MTKHTRGRGRGRGRGGRGRGGGRGRASSNGGSPHRQQKKQQQPQPPPAPQPQRGNSKPPPFPGFRGRPDRFVEQPDPQFQEVVSTCYAGFCIEKPETFDSKVHSEARRAFDGLEEGGVFRADVTQPFGLGTKCAVTYVTRTLVGEPGTTYKYLGLRMFSHPWTDETEPGSNNSSTDSSSSSSKGSSRGGGTLSALRRVRFLNDRLKERSLRLLEARKAEQGKAGRRRGESGGAGGGGGGEEEEFGSCEFNVALINRMEPSEDRPDLKLEPTFGQDRCSVSWHADSCLEHYSTIAVYHVTDPEDPGTTDSDNGGGGTCAGSGTDWRIALRVEPDAEGPSAGKLKLAAAAANPADKLDRAPPVAVALPSRSAYFLLDDFNHHHQHAVLAGQSHRWSSTHRVAKKQGHSFDYIAGRCQTVLGDGHRRTLKQWKTEQLTLSELEFEWIRQFYVQGRAHHALHTWWHEPLQQLLRFWSLLEGRTGVVVNTLQGAAEARFDQQHPAGGAGAAAGPDERREKKARQKRSKQRQAVESLGGRAAYVAITDALRDRAEKRAQWAERERDKVFDRLPADARPMPCPLSPSSTSASSSAAAVSSPLPRTPEALAALADAVLEWGKIYSGEDGVRGGGISDDSTAVAAGQVVRGAEGREAGADVEPGGVNVAAAAAGAVSSKGCDGDGGGDDGTAGDVAEHLGSTRPPDNSRGRNSAVEVAAAAAPTTAPAAAAAAAAGTSVSDPPPWETGRFALEMQAPWARRLLDGKKTVETRGYPLPAGLLGRSIELMESGAGRDGVSGVGDTVEAFADGLSVVGRVVFSRSAAYPSREAWAADATRHLVPVAAAEEPSTGGSGGSGGGGEGDKGYGWKGRGSVHAWTVGSVAAYPKPRAVRRMERAFRSLFLVEAASSGRGGNADGGADDGGPGGGGTKRKKKPKKKRKRKGPAAGGGDGDGGDGEEVRASSADTATAECAAPAVAGGVAGASGATGRPAETRGEEKNKRKRPRAGGGDGDNAPQSRGVAPGRGGSSGSPRGGGGGGDDDRERRQRAGGKKRSGSSSAEVADGGESPEGRQEASILAALAAAAASARGTGDGFDGASIDGEEGGGTGSTGDVSLARPGRGGDARKRSSKKKKKKKRF